MMKCPCCGGRALTFGEYWVGLNAIRVHCRQCGRLLQANRVTWAWIASCFIIGASIFAFLFANIGRFVVPDEVGAPAIPLFVLFFATMSWFTGGYVAASTGPSLQEKEATTDETAGAEEQSQEQ